VRVDPEDLIPEVRQHARRRRARNLGAVLAVAALVAGIAGLIGSGSRAGSRPGRSSSPPPASATRPNAHTVSLRAPSALAIGPDGQLYVADRQRQQILVRHRDGRFSVIAGTGAGGDSGDGGPATEAELRNPDSLAVARDGVVYFSQVGTVRLAGGFPNTVIRAVTPDGRISTVAGQDPDCHAVPATADAMPARSAEIDGANLSIGSDGRLDLSADVCPNVRHLDTLLQLAPSGRLVPTAADAVPTVSGLCGGGATGPGFTVFACSSGAGRGPRLMVVRSTGSTQSYPDDAAQTGSMSASHGTVVVSYDRAIVKVGADGLHTLATEQQITHLVPRAVGVMGEAGIAVSRQGVVYSIESVLVHRYGCISLIVRVSPTGAVRAVWRSGPNQACF
jgi:hypothetical protein